MTVFCKLISNEYVKDYTFELRRKIRIYDWSSQLYTELKRLWDWGSGLNFIQALKLKSYLCNCDDQSWIRIRSFISIISEVNKDFPAIGLVELFLIWRKIDVNIVWACRTKSQHLNAFATSVMADGCWMNVSERHNSKSRVFKRTKVALGSKSLSTLVFKEFKNRKRSGHVDRNQFRSIDQNLSFFNLKLLNF